MLAFFQPFLSMLFRPGLLLRRFSLNPPAATWQVKDARLEALEADNYTEDHVRIVENAGSVPSVRSRCLNMLAHTCAGERTRFPGEA